MKKSVREFVFFLLVFLLFYLVAKLKSTWKHMDPEITVIVSGLLYTVLIIAVFFLARLHSTTEGFWDVSDYAKCKGGAYFWQGDSENSKMCRDLASTPEGRIGISSYNCPTGYVGQPGLPFYYSPLSDDNWTNERCQDRPTCPGVDVGLCSLEKQVE